MTVMTIVSWMFCGLLVGLVARAVIPGRQSLNILTTIALGIAGACVGGFLYWMLMGQTDVSFSLAGNAWHGWIVSVVGAALVLLGFTVMQPRRWWQ